MSAREKILEILEGKEFCSGEDLAKSLKISRQALHKQIQTLRREGYKIDGIPKKGYQLTFKLDRLHIAEIRGLLTTDFIGQKIVYEKAVNSTQDLARKFADQDEKEGTLCIAEIQTAGRGRLGRSWSSGEGGLWFSILLRPKVGPAQVPLFSLVASLAVAKGIETLTSVSCHLKWPNDILVETEPEKYKKICGILVEMASESDRVQWVIAGIGLNVNNEIPNQLKETAVSLKSVSGSNLNRDRLLCVILTELENYYGRLLREGFSSLRNEYLDKFPLLGKRVLLSNFEIETEGECVTVDPEGCLVLWTKDQNVEKFSCGDVTMTYEK